MGSETIYSGLNPAFSIQLTVLPKLASHKHDLRHWVKIQIHPSPVDSDLESLSGGVGWGPREPQEFVFSKQDLLPGKHWATVSPRSPCLYNFSAQCGSLFLKFTHTPTPQLHFYLSCNVQPQRHHLG